MSGKAFMRAMAGRLREAFLGSSRIRGDGGARGGPRAATGGQIVKRSALAGEAGGSPYGGRADGGQRGAKGAHGGGQKGAKQGPHGDAKQGAHGDGPKGSYGGGPKGANEGGPKGAHGGGQKGSNKDAHGGGRTGDYHGAHGGGPKGDSGGAKDEGAKGRSRWSSFKTRVKNLLYNRDWVQDIDDIDDHIKTAERLKDMAERADSLRTWMMDRLVAASVTITVACSTLTEKVQNGTTAVKDRVLELKDAVKERLSPTKATHPKCPIKDEAEGITPLALDFSP